jgi:hypothetical protein
MVRAGRSINGRSTQVVQPGNGDALTFINEFGNASAGYIQDSGHVVTADGGDWANGTSWNQNHW